MALRLGHTIGEYGTNLPLSGDGGPQRDLFQQEQGSFRSLESHAACIQEKRKNPGSGNPPAGSYVSDHGERIRKHSESTISEGAVQKSRSFCTAACTIVTEGCGLT